MRKRMLGGLLIASAAAGLLGWGSFHSRAESPAESKETATKGAPAAAPAASPKPSVAVVDRAPLERVIRAQSAAMFAEFNAKDAGTLVSRFQTDATYELESGTVITGRDALQKHFEAAFSRAPEAQARIVESRIRFPTADIASDEGTVAVAQDSDSPEEQSRYVATWVRQDGHWKLKTLREMAAAAHSKSAHEHLHQLDWLIGEWLHESPDSLVKSSCRWSADGNFLLQDFKVQIDGAVVVAGSQRIGWDPLTKKVRSWVFDSEGGFGEAFWNWDGDHWVIRSSAVKYDGEITSSLNFVTPINGDSYRWEASHRMSGDTNLSDLDVVIARQGPAPEAPTAPLKIEPSPTSKK